MAYSSIIKMRDRRMAYNIQDEKVGDWQTFIVNDQFDKVLYDTVRAVRNNDADRHKPIWIAGTYGTGKSHAGSVLKHLLCDPVEDIREYVEAEYSKPQYDKLKSAIYDLRAEKRLFPVYMHSTEHIAHEEDLSLHLQRVIQTALQNAHLDISVQTDFDTYVQHIEERPQFWEDLIAQNGELRGSAPDVNKLKQCLKNDDAKVLGLVKDALRKARFDIRMESTKLGTWIFEVQKKLREQSDYCGLLIIWDELQELIRSSIGINILVQLQEIAEMMMNPDNDSYFLFISHPNAFDNIRDEEREKTKGRYNYETYNMEPVSAFKIMKKKFQILNYSVYMSRQEKFFNNHPEVLAMFSSNSASSEATIENIKDLYPLHPGTANLAAYFAREAGSSSRSVFEFLACDKVHEFMEDDEVYMNHQTITADYLWDYVQEFFESDTTRFGAVTERYNSHHLAVESQGENYLKVFKGILLLNALNNIANSDTVTPSTENIENLFIGTDVEGQLPEILDFFNDKSIIQRQPNGNFSILFTALPGDEIQKIKADLKASTYLYTDAVIKFGDVAFNIFGRSNFSQVARPLKFGFFSIQANDYTLSNRIENALHSAQPYETILAIMVGRNMQEVMQLQDFAARYSCDDRFHVVTFAVMDTPMGDKEYERFIEYQANAQCAQKHGLPQQQQTYSKQAAEMIGQWVREMKSGNVTFYLNGDSFSAAGSKMASTINLVIAPAIFTSGPESLALIRTKSSVTYWKKASVKATVDAVLSYNTKQDILDKCGGPARHVEFLLQDSVDDNLHWKDTIDPNHPLKKVCDYVDEWLSGKHTSRNQPFNLGEKLIGLTEPPFGLFQSYAPMAMVAFAMRNYVNRIFDTNGKPRSAQHLVEDVVEMFKAWENGKESNKLNFMFESKEAGKVCKVLINAFNLKSLKNYSDISSLKDARWAIQHEFASDRGYPVWSLKYVDGNPEEMKDFIDNLMKVVNDPESMKNPTLLTNMLNGYSNLSTDFGNLLIPSADNFRKGFVNYLKSIDTVNLKDAEFDSAFQYLREHLEGTVGLWTEEEVKDKTKDWRISVSTQPRDAEEPFTPPTDPTQPPVPPMIPPISPDELKAKRQKALVQVQSVANLYNAIERMINNEDSHTIDILLKYV